MKTRRILFLALGVLIAGAFLLPLTTSAVTWNPSYLLGDGGAKPSVAIDSQGGIHYAWWEPTAKIIQYRYCSGLAANTCGQVETLPNNGGDSYYPSLAIDPNDVVNAVWEAKEGSSYAVYFSKRVNGQWTAIKKLSQEPYSELPDIAIGSQGIIHVSYQSKQNNTGYVYYVESNDGFESSVRLRIDQAESDRPIAVAAEVRDLENGAEGTPLANGLFPRIAVDANDRAHIVWNAPSPYGVYYRIQQQDGSFGRKLTVSTGRKDQTPDVIVSSNGAVAILWGTYDNFNVALAEYNGTTRDLLKYDVDGGLEQSLWPRVSADCVGILHLVFQGKTTADSNWNVYHRSYDSATNTFTKRKTIADSGGQEQTPAIATTNIAAVAFTNTSSAQARGSNATLSCGVNPTNTPTNTPTKTATFTATATKTNMPAPGTNTPTPTRTNTAAPTMTSTATRTPTPTSTATATATAAATPTIPSGGQHIPSNDPRIVYIGNWKPYKNKRATDNGYMRCGIDGKCKKDSSAELNFVGGSRLEWETVYANTYGKAKVFIDGALFEQVDLCKPRPRSPDPKFAKRTYVLSGNGSTAHSIKIVSIGHSRCSPYQVNYIAVDGFNILP